ncbi:MAG: PorT family protein, partial [Bacteroidales bacterium]|nr:PorT family protein [Bacteroidales bacterium]
GISGGLTYEYRLNTHFILGADFLYVQKGFTNDVTFIDINGNPLGDGTSKFHYDYLSLPIKGGYMIGDRISGFVNLGIVPSFLIDAKTIIPVYNNEDIIDEPEGVTKFDLAVLIEIGGSYKFKDRFLLFASLAYQHGTISITNSDYFANSKIAHYGMTLSMGLKYALKKE